MHRHHLMRDLGRVHLDDLHRQGAAGWQARQELGRDVPAPSTSWVMRVRHLLTPRVWAARTRHAS